MSRLTAGLVLAAAVLAWPRDARGQDANAFLGCPPPPAGAPVQRFLGAVPDATRIHLTGDVVLPCGDTTLSADDVVYDRTSDIVEATGHVHLQRNDLSIYGDRAVLNRKTRMGTFYNAQGSAQLGEKPDQKSLFGTAEPDVYFWGEEIARVGEDVYQLTDGGFTTCVQPSRRWEITSAKGTVRLDHSVVMRNVLLKVKDVPFLYLPAFYYPINKEDRATGFLLPQYGSSTQLGTSLSNAFFWAINRSQDATFYHDWYSKGGQGFSSEYRYVATPGSQGQVSYHMLDQHVATAGESSATSAQRRYQLNGSANQELPHGFRVYGRADYFSDAATQQLYQDIYDYSQRTRSFSAALSGSLKGFRIGTTVDRQDLFYGAQPGQRSGHAPSLTLGMGDRPIGKTKIYVGASGEATYIVRQNDLDDPTTDRSLWRFDASPTIRAPLSTLPYLSATGSASWRITRWLETLDPITQEVVPVAMNRQLFQMTAQVTGPVFARVFQTPDNGYAERFKHVIEPSFSITRTTPFADFDRVIVNDYAVDGIVGGTTSIQYQLTNRLLARRKTSGGTPGSSSVIREILSVDLSQTYYSNALASVYDPSYQTGAITSEPSPFSALQLRVSSRPTDTASAQFRMSIDPKYRAIQTLNASGSLDSSHVQVTAGWSKRLTIEGSPDYPEEFADNYLNASTTIRTSDNRVGGSYVFNFDVKDASFLQQRIVAYYNSQCCGISFDWQTITTPLLSIPSDRRLGISFTLAGIGSFANPLGSFGGSSAR
ncbi:MAG TPA: putative LPS assembly protein LptD [Vicinamibacterales bacterium]|jgi:lipopolysaccharide assembly outer membrane protein LptD (OstA)|nr:putative LPS assembly protein LptD [Vicinamibacterales bacterium]